MAFWQIWRKLLLFATFLRVHSNSKKISYLFWQNRYPNLKTICHIMLNFFLLSKLPESLLLAKYFIYVTATLNKIWESLKTCSRPTCLGCLGANVPYVLMCSRANVSCVLRCSRANMPWELTCLICQHTLCAYILPCQHCFRAHVLKCHRAFSPLLHTVCLTTRAPANMLFLLIK